MKEFDDALNLSSVFLQCFIVQVKLLPYSEVVRYSTSRLLIGCFTNVEDFDFIGDHFELL